ncbi:hypothetical protein GH714_010508 [Hevea brasiliensis]|uniref:CASP-like protein n=1 Tax=Hevea brasiliensis TaxID=3981 RepID=A0A6A6MY85_HEVBR|nr:hypothetical protein GH714_010508 [Hevea brasiliensis]
MASLIVLMTHNTYTLEVVFVQVKVHFKDVYAYQYMIATITTGFAYTILQIAFKLYHIATGIALMGDVGSFYFDFYGDKCYFWLWKLGGRVLDIEIETITDEDDHKPQLTAGALEKAFPTLTHGKISDKCAICLEKFKEEDKCRMFLPSCIHIFHKACIDLWLSKDNGCPLCGVDLFSKL